MFDEPLPDYIKPIRDLYKGTYLKVGDLVWLRPRPAYFRTGSRFQDIPGYIPGIILRVRPKRMLKSDPEYISSDYAFEVHTFTGGCHSRFWVNKANQRSYDKNNFDNFEYNWLLTGKQSQTGN